MSNICQVAEYLEYESFVSSHEKGHFLQSERWARLKSNWGRVFLLAKDSDGKTIGAVSALLRPLPGIRRSLMVCARGPVCDPGDEKTYEALLRALIEEAKSRRCYCLRFEPELSSDDEKAKKLLPALGFLKMDGAYQGLHPHMLWRKEIRGLSDEMLLESFSQKTRYNVRLAMRKGVRIDRCGREEIPQWFALLRQTGKRDGISVRDEAYFQDMMKIWGDALHLYLAYFEGEPIAGIIVLSYAGKNWFLYGASGDRHRTVKASALLHYRAICDAVERGDRLYDFRGVSGYGDEKSPAYGIYRFKRGFGGDLVALAGAYELVFNRKINDLTKLGQSLLKKWRRVKV